MKNYILTLILIAAFVGATYAETSESFAQYYGIECRSDYTEVCVATDVDVSVNEIDLIVHLAEKHVPNGCGELGMLNNPRKKDLQIIAVVCGKFTRNDDGEVVGKSYYAEFWKPKAYWRLYHTYETADEAVDTEQG